MASPEELAEILQLLDTADRKKREELFSLIQENLDSGKETWLIKVLVDNFFKTRSEHTLKVLFSARESYVKVLLDKIKDGLGAHKMAALDLFGRLVIQQHHWMHKLPSHAVLSSVIKLIKTEQSVPALISAVLSVAALLPSVPVLIGHHLNDLFDACLRVMRLLSNKPANTTDVHWLHLHVSLRALLLRLYAMYPCKLLVFLRTKFSKGEMQEAFYAVLKPLLTQFRMHPMLVTGHKDMEVTKDKWKELEPHDIVLECSQLEADMEPVERAELDVQVCSSCGPASSNNQQSRASSTLAHTSKPQATRELQLAFISGGREGAVSASSLLQQQLREMEEAQSVLSLSEAPGWTTPPVGAPRVSPSHAGHDPPPTSPFKQPVLGGSTSGSRGGSVTQTPTGVQSAVDSPALPHEEPLTPGRHRPTGLRGRDSGLPLGTPVTTPGGPDSVPPSPGRPPFSGTGPIFPKSAVSAHISRALTFQEQPVAVAGLDMSEVNIAQVKPAHSFPVDDLDQVLTSMEPPADDGAVDELDQEVGEIISSDSTEGLLTASQGLTPGAMSTRSEEHGQEVCEQVEPSTLVGDTENLARFVRDAKHRLSESEPSVAEKALAEITHEESEKTIVEESLLEKTAVASTAAKNDLPAPLALTEAEARRQLSYLPLLPAALPRWFCAHCGTSDRAGSYSFDDAKAADGTIDLLSEQLAHGSNVYRKQLRFSAVSTLTDLKSPGSGGSVDEIELLRAQLLLQNSQLQIERQRRQALAKRNRRALGRISEHKQRHEQVLAQQGQIKLMSEEVDKLRLENKLLREQERQTQDMKLAERQLLQDRIHALQQEVRVHKEHEHELCLSEHEHREAYRKQRDDLQALSAKLFGLEKEMDAAAAEAAMAVELKREVSNLSKRVMLLSDICKQYKERQQDGRATHQPQAQALLLQQSLTADNTELRQSQESTTSQLEGLRARLTQAEDALKEKDRAIYEQKQLLERTKALHIERMQAVEEKHLAVCRALNHLESHALQLRADLDASSSELRLLRMRREEPSAPRPIPQRPLPALAADAAAGLSPAQSVGSGSGVVAYSSNHSAFSEYHPVSSPEDSTGSAEVVDLTTADD